MAQGDRRRLLADRWRSWAARPGSVVLARVFTAVVAGYAFTSLLTAFVARFLPLTTIEKTIAATLSSFAVFAALIILTFSVRRLALLWLYLVPAAIVLAVPLWWSIAAEGRL